MDDVYYILTGDGPEMREWLKIEAANKATIAAWKAFARKWIEPHWDNSCPLDIMFVHYGMLGGISFRLVQDPEPGNPRTLRPTGWRAMTGSGKGYCVPTKDCGEAYTEFKALPEMLYDSELGKRLGELQLVSGQLYLQPTCIEVGGKELRVLVCPIDQNDWTVYVPKGPHVELSAGAYVAAMHIGEPPVVKPHKLVIAMDGGIIQSVCLEDPLMRSLIGQVVTVDYDTEGADSQEISLIPQGNGKVCEAVVLRSTVEPLGITLPDWV